MNSILQNALNALRNATHWLGRDNLAEHVEWVHTADDAVEVAVPKSTGKSSGAVTPARFSGFFQISPSTGWYLEPDMGMNVANPAKWQLDKGLEAAFADGRGSCILVPVPSHYPELHNDFYSKYVPNAEEVMRKCMPRVTKSGFFNKDSEGHVSFKISHRLYQRRALSVLGSTSAKPSKSAKNGKKRSRDSDDQDCSSRTFSDLDQDIKPPFRIANLPVSPACQPILDKIVPTHEFNPVCAFEHGSREPIVPSDYGLKLRGAIVEAHFTLSHRFIMRRGIGKTSHFTATIDELVILGMPTEISLAPSMQRNRALFTISGIVDDDESEEATGEAENVTGPTPKRGRK